MSTSPDIFLSQSSVDSNSLSVCFSDICKIFNVSNYKKATYCTSNREKSVWVLFASNLSSWEIYWTNHRTPCLSVEQFLHCCSIQVDSFFTLPEETLEIDPFTFDETPATPAPVLRLVSSEDNQDVRISTSLFAQLFKRDVVLSSSGGYSSCPCLVGLPDGRVLFWHSSQKLAKLICHLYQPVVDILSGPEGSLLCIGQRGKVICISIFKGSLQYSTVFLHGPVTSCCFNGFHLYHTTLCYQLWKSTLTFDSRGQANVLQTDVPVVSAKKVQYEASSDTVKYLSEDNILDDIPASLPNLSFSSQHQKLHWLSSEIAKQSESIQQLVQLVDQCSTLLHDLTCAAWLATPDKCGLKCQYDILPVPGQGSTYNIRTTFTELGKLCPSGLWVVCTSVSQTLSSCQENITKTFPVSSDVVFVDITVPICFGSKSKSWGSSLRPPLEVECSILFGGVPFNSLLNTLPCPSIKFTLETFLLDEFTFLTEKSYKTKAGSLDNLILSIAKQKAREKIDDSPSLGLQGRLLCNLRLLTFSEASINDVENSVWQKLLPEICRNSKSKVLFLFGHEVKLWCSSQPANKDGDSNCLCLFFETDCPALLAGLRTSAASRLQNIDKVQNMEVKVSTELVTQAQNLNSELEILKSCQSFEKVLQFYLKLRNEFSFNLPLL